jgi:hypothetical protein
VGSNNLNGDDGSSVLHNNGGVVNRSWRRGGDGVRRSWNRAVGVSGRVTSGADTGLESVVLSEFGGAFTADLGLHAESAELHADAGEIVGRTGAVGDALKDYSLLERLISPLDERWSVGLRAYRALS